MSTETTLTRITLHMALTGFFLDDPDTQIRKMAKRYRKQATCPKIRRSMKLLIKHKRPIKVVWAVYKKDIEGAQLPCKEQNYLNSKGK